MPTRGLRLAARGETPAAFGRRCNPADCVAPPSNIPDILSRRALSAGRLAALGATLDFYHGLLALDVAVRLLVMFAVLSIGERAAAQTSPPTPGNVGTAETRDEGIPIRSELVRAKCGSCHRSDQQQRLSRISYRRATPENWERTIKRMAALNKVDLDPADARIILK
jgi:hypothetical protein